MALKGVTGLAAALIGAPAIAAAVAVADIRIDWNTLAMSVDGSLVLAPDTNVPAQFRNFAHLGVSQVWLAGVALDPASLQNLSYQPVDADRSIHYTAGTAANGASADLATGSAGSSALVRSADDDGDVLTANLVNAYIGRGARYLATGTGTLSVSFDYDLHVLMSGIDGMDAANVNAFIALGLDQWTSASGGLSLVGNARDRLSRLYTLTPPGTDLTLHGTLSVTMPFDNASGNLVQLEINGGGITFANSAAGGPQPMPEPGTLLLVPVALAALARRRSG